MLALGTLLIFVIGFGLLNRGRGHDGFPSTIHGLGFAVVMYYWGDANLWLAVLTLLGYELGERQTWGEWVGITAGYGNRISKNTLENYKPWYKPTYWIAWLTGKMIPEWWVSKERSVAYANVALAMRGILWFGLTLLSAASYGIISWAEWVGATAVLGMGFPLSTNIAQITQKWEWMQIEGYFKGAWEQAEGWYGIMQGIVLYILIIGV